MHLNPVREKAEVIKRAKSAVKILATRPIRDLEPFAAAAGDHASPRERRRSPLPPKGGRCRGGEAAHSNDRRETKLKTVDMRAYQQIVEARLNRHFRTNPTLQKIRAGETVSAGDITGSCLARPDRSQTRRRSTVLRVFPETAGSLLSTIRSHRGSGPGSGRRCASQNLRGGTLKLRPDAFLGLLKQHIARFGSVDARPPL